MIREIKFRIYKPAHGSPDKKEEMLYSDDGMLTIGKYGWDETENENGWRLMEFTGYRDKSGRCIYEGDIIDDYAERGVIYWDRGAAGFRIKGLKYGWANVAYAPHELKVVGNVWLDPKLIPDTLSLEEARAL